MRGLVAMAAALAGGAAQAATPVGAPVAAPMQPGAWGAGGWQPGASPAVPAAPVTPSAPTDEPAPIAPPAYAQAPSAPGAYRPVRPGAKLPGGYADPIYTVWDWRAYGLGTPYPGTRWVRYFDDAVLADAHGRAIDVRRVAWDAPRRREPSRQAAAPYVPPVASTRTVRTGPDTTVTTQVIPPPTGYYGGGSGPDYGWGPGVTVTPSIVTTTTTTRYEPVAARRR